MIRKITLIFLCLILVFSSASCSMSDISSQSTPLLEFDIRSSTLKLIDAFNTGEPPLSVYVMYDQMGSNPGADVTDPYYIQSVYDALSEIKITGETQESVTDCYHCVAFTFSDGTSAAFNFEGVNIISIDSRNYNISDAQNLFKLIKSKTIDE